MVRQVRTWGIEVKAVSIIIDTSVRTCCRISSLGSMCMGGAGGAAGGAAVEMLILMTSSRESSGIPAKDISSRISLSKESSGISSS